jgi:hypothetical protein
MKSTATSRVAPAAPGRSTENDWYPGSRYTGHVLLLSLVQSAPDDDAERERLGMIAEDLRTPWVRPGY